MSAEVTKSTKRVNGDEIDLIALAKNLWEGRRTVIRTVIIFIFLGLFIAIFSPKEFTATTTMVPQINSPTANMGGLSSLASLAGFNLDMNMGGTDISPILYPKIVSSTSFQLEIMNAKYRFEELDHEVSLYNYYMDYFKPGIFELMKKYTIELPDLIMKNYRQDSQNIFPETDSLTIRISKEQDKVIDRIEEQLSLSVNDKEGYLTLSSSFHQPELSAQIAQKAQKLLQDYITRFKIEKARSQLIFIQERYFETKREFELAQTRLANFRDANKNISSSLAQTEQERLENEYQITYEVYSELAKQLEQARITVKEDTPVFAVIEEVTIPIEKSKPNRIMILIIWFVLGIIVGFGWILGRISVSKIRSRWSMEQP